MSKSFVRSFIAFVAVVACLTFAIGAKVSYEGHKVVELNCASAQDANTMLMPFLASREAQVFVPDGELPQEGALKGAHILLNPLAYAKTLNLVNSTSCVISQILVENIQKLMDKEQDTDGSLLDDWNSQYHTFTEIVERLKYFTQQYPSLAKFVPSIAKSVEGRDIPVLRFTGSSSSMTKKQVWFNGGQHAREWIGPATVMYLIETLLSGYQKVKTITDILDKVEFLVAPVINPDGYSYSWTNDRLWRKNRRNNGDGSYGVDLNRNWDDHWGQGGSSSSPKSDTYKGKAAFSEPETKGVADYILKVQKEEGSKIITGIDYHAYGQLVLRSWGWTKTNPPDEKILKGAGDGVRDAIAKVHGIKYTSEHAAELYITTGSTDDWFYDVPKFWGFTIELRDTGRYGFQLPANQIIATGEENLEGFLFLVNYALSNQ